MVGVHVWMSEIALRANTRFAAGHLNNTAAVDFLMRYTTELRIQWKIRGRRYYFG